MSVLWVMVVLVFMGVSICVIRTSPRENLSSGFQTK